MARFGEPEWFVIHTGEYAGRLHMQGWMLSAIRTSDGWMPFATCPRCYAMVLTDTGHQGDWSWAHEQWHARTDWPVPESLL